MLVAEYKSIEWGPDFMRHPSAIVNIFIKESYGDVYVCLYEISKEKYIKRRLIVGTTNYEQYKNKQKKLNTIAMEPKF